MSEDADVQSVGRITGFPFDTFTDLQAAVTSRKFKIGVDPLSAAQWSEGFNTRPRKLIVGSLSMLLIAAAIASVAVAFATENYWLLAAIPIQAMTFYWSHPASPIRKWVTVAGACSVILFANLLLNHLTTAAALAAYAGLTFAAVRAAGFMANSAFRKALQTDEDLFTVAYTAGACSLRNKETGKIYQS